MSYLVNTKSGLIHDISKAHAKKLTGNHYTKVDTFPEAKAKVKKAGKIPKVCKHCGFNQAAIEECKI